MSKSENNLKGEKKILDNRPDLAKVNQYNDVYGNTGKSTVSVVTVLVITVLIICSIGFAFFGNWLPAGILFFFALVLFFTTLKGRFKKNKYKVDEETRKRVKPIFKD